MTYRELWKRLTGVYDEGEAKAVARMVFEVKYGLSLADLLLGRDELLPHNELEALTQRLEQGEPVQYVLGLAEFYGRTFRVAPGVLIPRPETEELCRWVLESRSEGPERVLDIGTGSGCIACTLAAERPQAEATAWDISAGALAIAQSNAQRLHVHVTFEQVDILHLHHPTPDTRYSTIVSNPPYICHNEAEKMERNVLDHEPWGALFVPDEDPLLFYRTISRYAQSALVDGGWLYFELNPLYAPQVQALLDGLGFRTTEIKNDQYGKQRFIRARI